jgi:hypothetical protein
VDDAQRYRLNAAECIFAGERCEPAYRDLTFAIAESWLSLAHQQEAMDEFLAIWREAQYAAPILLPFQLSSNPARGRIIAFQEAISA